MKYILTFLLVVFMLGCSSKDEFANLINNDSLYTNAIAYTKKATIKKDKQTVAYLTITYLNQLYPQTYADKEYMFVGVNIENANNVLNEKFFLYLLEQEQKILPQNIQEANLDEFTNLPLQNRWSSYYLVSFEKSSSSDLKMKFGNEELGYEEFTIIKNRDK